jgi:ZIP family zinc transporter
LEVAHWLIAYSKTNSFTMASESDNVGIALALVVGAGASTGLGAAVVFFPSIVKLASRRVLAASLGFSAGVMTYVSFIEIFSKSHSSYMEAGFEENMAYVYSTICFFGGVIIMMVSLFTFLRRSSKNCLF